MALFKYVLVVLVVGACIYKLVAGSSIQRDPSRKLRENSAALESVPSTSQELPPEEPSLDHLATTLSRDTDTSSAASRLHPTVLQADPIQSQVHAPTIPFTQAPSRYLGRQFFSGSGIFGPQFQLSFPHNSFPVPSYNYNRPSHLIATASSGEKNAKDNQSGGVKLRPPSSSVPVRPILPPKPSLTILSPIADDSHSVHITPKPLRGSHKPTTSNSGSDSHLPHINSQHHHIPTIRPQIIYSQTQKPHGQNLHNTPNVPQKPHDVASHVNQEESSHGPYSGDDSTLIQHYSDDDVIAQPLFSGVHITNVPQIHRQVYVVDFPGYGSFMVLGGPRSPAAHLPHTPVGYATLYNKRDGVTAVVARH